MSITVPKETGNTIEELYNMRNEFWSIIDKLNNRKESLLTEINSLSVYCDDYWRVDKLLDDVRYKSNAYLKRIEELNKLIYDTL